jgi:hypothetical protein
MSWSSSSSVKTTELRFHLLDLLRDDRHDRVEKRLRAVLEQLLQDFVAVILDQVAQLLDRHLLELVARALQPAARVPGLAWLKIAVALGL